MPAKKHSRQHDMFVIAPIPFQPCDLIRRIQHKSNMTEPSALQKSEQNAHICEYNLPRIHKL